MKQRIIFVFAFLFLFLPFISFAQQYPTKPITLIVPYPAGGATDVMARLIAEQLSQRWKVSVVVDNRAGSGGMIGADAVAKSAPDGYTLLIANVSMTSNPAIWKVVNYDAATDLATQET